MFMARTYVTQLSHEPTPRSESSSFKARINNCDLANRKAIEEYKQERLEKGLLAKEQGGLDAQREMLNKIPLPVEGWSGHRRMSDQIVDLLDMVVPGGRKNANEWFPGLVSMNQDMTVNVFADLRDFIRAKTTPMKFGKYLRKTGMYSDSEINTMANKFKSTQLIMDSVHLSFARGERAIIAVYEYGPHSCMAGGANKFYGSEHPVAVYDTPDIGVAYVMLAGRIVARALCNLREQTYSVVYGNEELMEPLLEKAGYSDGDLTGCRILKIEDTTSGRLIMPYIDGADHVGEHDGHYLIVGQGSDYECTETDGVSNDGEYSYECSHCGIHSYEDYDGLLMFDNGDIACDTACAEDLGYRFVESRSEWMNVDDLYFCETDGEYYADCDDLVEIDGDMYHLDDESIVYSEYANEHVHRDYCTYADWLEDWIPDYDYQMVLEEHEAEEAEEEEDADEDDDTQTSTVFNEHTSPVAGIRFSEGDNLRFSCNTGERTPLHT